MDSRIPSDFERVVKAFGETINRHGSFRTKFHWDGEKGKLLQMVHPPVNIHNASIFDLSDEPSAYKEAYEMSLANNMNLKSSLDKLPLVSSIIFNLRGGALHSILRSTS